MSPTVQQSTTPLEKLMKASGKLRIGQIELSQSLTESNYLIYHIDDLPTIESDNWDDLKIHNNPQAAIQISRLNKKQGFRFLKASPDLVTGWVFRLHTLNEVMTTLNFIYPAAISLWIAHLEQRLRIEPLRDKLERQTGMYRNSSQLSLDELKLVVAESCNQFCSKIKLWSLEKDQLPLEELKPQTSNLEFLCPQACNWLVAQCSRKTKQIKASK